ncbi:HEPN domain-containing protein [Flavobacterium sp.]|uniref:ApeA N-terminal domain 1-containing protein n=1 Tax=Flavobacterium sp. TaxID=239 RepID=UPI0022C41C35|nr:HEPN domain-containing protein [Flavobacterium sp.]MCZ8090108.1 hypothetical protein [Flavobacterium sp.]
MIDKFEHKGLWFLPSNTERKIHGILKYDYQNNINVLELIGSFYDFASEKSGKENIILGITTDDVDITLVDCRFSSSSGIPRNDSSKFKNRRESALATLNFNVTSILKGEHIFKQENLKFQKGYAKIFNLDEWVGVSGFEEDFDYTESTKTILYKTLEPINVKINDDVDMEIKFVTNNPMPSGFTKELTLSQYTILSFHSEKYFTLEEFMSLLRKFNRFLTTSLQNPVRIERIELYSDQFCKVIFEDYKDIKCINLYQIINSELKFEKRKQESEMLFTYDDIKNDFEKIIKKWFSNYEKFEASFNLVLSQFYISQYYLESLFINTVQAAESFHRKLEIGNDMPKTQQDNEHNEKLRRVIESAPEDLKKWIESQIPRPPKHYLGTRLEYLFENFSNEELNVMIGNKEKFIKEITKSRQYYTHYNTDNTKDALDGVELIDLYLRLRLLIICGFLIETGFEKTLLEKLIKEKAYNMFRDLMS